MAHRQLASLCRTVVKTATHPWSGMYDQQVAAAVRVHELRARGQLGSGEDEVVAIAPPRDEGGKQELASGGKVVEGTKDEGEGLKPPILEDQQTAKVGAKGGEIDDERRSEEVMK